MKLKFLKTAIATLFIGLMSIGYAHANLIPFQISMAVDNDFAIFSGNSTSINNLLYQNNVRWDAQIASLSTLNFTLPAGDNKFYILGIGGGGEENISGLINGVNITSVSVAASMSSNLKSFLSGYNASTVEKGIYNVNLMDVQNAFSNASWSNAASNLNTTDIVIKRAGFGSGFAFSNKSAHLFSFDASAVGVQVSAVPEPTTLAIFALGMIGFASRRFKK